MNRKVYHVELYKKINNSFILNENEKLTSKEAGVKSFNNYIDEYYLTGEPVERLEEHNEFIWRLKTDKYLLILRKDF